MSKLKNAITYLILRFTNSERSKVNMKMNMNSSSEKGNTGLNIINNGTAHLIIGKLEYKIQSSKLVVRIPYMQALSSFSLTNNDFIPLGTALQVLVTN